MDGVLSYLMESAVSETKVPYLDVFNTLVKSEIWMDEVAQNEGSHPWKLWLRGARTVGTGLARVVVFENKIGNKINLSSFR